MFGALRVARQKIYYLQHFNATLLFYFAFYLLSLCVRVVFIIVVVYCCFIGTFHLQDWAIRSEEQSLMIERVLVLIRNVLQVPANPEAECRADNDASLHDQVIWALHQSGVMDLVLFVVSSPDEHQFHLHGLEILCLLYREQVSICTGL